MVTAIVLLKVGRAKINEVAAQLVAMAGISEVYSVSGRYDLVALARVANNDELALLVTQELQGIEGIVKTETMLALQAFSRHDLEAMFSIGNDGN